MTVPFLELWDARVAADPSALAVVAPEASWSREELDARARRLAADLAAEGCGWGSIVALALGRSALHVAAVLAAWRAGAAFLPLDPLAPAARQRACVEEAGARLVLRVVDGQVAIDRTGAAPAPAPDAEHLAYVIYTSGSSGGPKGVRVGHGGLVPMLQAQIAAFGLAPGKRALFALSTAFDASISDLGTALLSGAALVVAPAPAAPAELGAFVRLHAVTHADLPPSLLARMDPADAPPSLETIIIGGEVCPPAVVRAWARRVRLVNVYGPTEATICTSLVRCDAATWDRPRIGAPLPHVEYRVEDGELLIGGPALALGYVNRPALDAARFVVRDGRRFYRTGDRVRPGSEDEPGGAAILGRVDRQVKLRGQLVAPEEIEMALLAMPEVLEAAVALDAAVLTARVVLRSGAQLEPDALRSRLAETLPRWMLPRVQIERSLPRGTTGKLDPRVAVIVAAFREILGAQSTAEEACADSDFFALGGDSLAALEIAAVAQAQGVVFEPAAVLDARTPAAIARSGPVAGRTVRQIESDVSERLARAELTPEAAQESLARAEGGAWLLTGVTGFLGRRVLGRLLAGSDRPVHCLVRAPDDSAARARLTQLGLSSPRLVVHAADVASPHLGMTPHAWRELAAQVGSRGHVVHLAAAVNQVLSFEMLAAANVTAALEVARLTRAAGATLTHVSTLAVLAASDLTARQLDEATVLSPGTHLFGGYAQSKYAAEVIVRRVAPRARIVRPGLLTGDSATGASSASCPLATFLRALAQLGCVPGEVARDEEHAPTVDVTPVDFAADALTALLFAPLDSPACQVPLVHLSSPRGATLADLVRAVRSRVDLAEVDAGTFVQRVRSRLSRESALAVAAASYRLLGREVARDADLFLLTGRAFDSSLASRLAGRACPPADDALLRRYVDAALR